MSTHTEISEDFFNGCAFSSKRSTDRTVPREEFSYPPHIEVGNKGTCQFSVHSTGELDVDLLQNAQWRGTRSEGGWKWMWMKKSVSVSCSLSALDQTTDLVRDTLTQPRHDDCSQKTPILQFQKREKFTCHSIFMFCTFWPRCV